MILALISSGDKHHGEAAEIVDKLRRRLTLSPYALVELDLMIRSNKVAVSEVEAFHKSLDAFLEHRNIRIPPPRPRYHAEAYALRRKYKQLTYFDSLHASIGIVENVELVSYDETYANIAGLMFKRPKERAQ